MSKFSSRIDSAKLTVNKMYNYNNYQSQFQVQNSSEQSAEENRNSNIRDFIGTDCADNCSFDHIFDQTIIEVTEAEKVPSRKIEDFGICLHSWRASLEHFLPVSSISC